MSLYTCRHRRELDRRLLGLAPIAALALAGCATAQPVTMAEIQLAAYVAGVEFRTDPTEMSERGRRAVVGFCLAQRRVQTQFDEVAAAYCAEAEEALLRPAMAPPPET